MDLTVVVILVGFIVFNCLSLFSYIASSNLMGYFEPLGHVGYIFSILYLGILASIVTAALSIYAIVRLGASTVSVFGNLGTVFNHCSRSGNSAGANFIVITCLVHP